MTSEELYQRLLNFAIDCLELVRKLPKNTYNLEYGGQLIRSSSSPGANYIEAIEGFSRKEFIHRLKICRKESKESIHWIRLIKHANKNLIEIDLESDRLIKEARELIRIFSSSISTSQKNNKK